MTQEEKQELVIALCGYLPYGVFITNKNGKIHVPLVGLDTFHKENVLIHGAVQDIGFHLTKNIENVKPYLRPMSSMTEEEKEEFIKFRWTTNDGEPRMYEWCDYANAHHLDYRGLIEKGLALEAPEGMYKTE